MVAQEQTAATNKQKRLVEAFFLSVGLFIVYGGFSGIDAAINEPLIAGVSWQYAAGMLGFGGMIAGVAINRLWALRKKDRP